MEREEYYQRLIKNILEQGGESSLIEFKEENAKIDSIGSYIAALANTLTIEGGSFAYMIWGIENLTLKVVGTSFDPSKTHKGNEDLIPHLTSLLDPKINFSFHEIDYEGKRLVLLEVSPTFSYPASYAGVEYVRIGSSLHRLKDVKEKERILWKKLDHDSAELSICLSGLSEEEVFSYLSFEGYYDRLGLPFPSNKQEAIKRFMEEGFLRKSANLGYDVTCLGGLLFAKNLKSIAKLERKGIRIVSYQNSSRIDAKTDVTFDKGYALNYEEILTYLKGLLPRQERIEGGLREEKPMFPERAIRELVGNLMIHQEIEGLGSLLIEVFPSRIEASNPGSLLVDEKRIIDAVPSLRNPKLAAFLRLIGICEERGSGFDRMEESLSAMHLPSPRAYSGESTRVVLKTSAAGENWTYDDRIWTAYISACLNYVNGNSSNNSFFRERLGIEDKNAAIVSRLLSQAVEEGLLKNRDVDNGAKKRSYVPFWARISLMSF